MTWNPWNLSFRHILFHEKNSFSDISRKCISPNMIRVVLALIIFGKISFLLKSAIQFFMKWNMTDGQVSWISCDLLFSWDTTGYKINGNLNLTPKQTICWISIQINGKSKYEFTRNLKVFPMVQVYKFQLADSTLQ